MRDVVGSTAEEKRLVTAIQRKLGIVDNGWIGTQTLSSIAQRLGADCFPISLTIYGQPCIISRGIVACNPNAPLRDFQYAISGSFSYQSKPCSILVNNGETVGASACHAWLKQPESVLYRTDDGRTGIKRYLFASELPQDTVWAVGGLGLLDNYDPAAEGFTGSYSDVLRRTNHTVLGVKDGWCYLCYLKSKTGAEVNAFCRDKLMLDYAVMLDGGHVAAINGETQINVAQRQYYIIQGV